MAADYCFFQYKCGGITCIVQGPANSSTLQPEKPAVVTSKLDSYSKAQKTFRALDPAHCNFTIDSFSKLRAPLESAGFETGGFRWKLVLYPTKRTEGNTTGSISLHLRIVETENFPESWKVHALFRFFIRDQTADKYLMMQDPLEDEIKCFREIKKEHGMDEIVSFEELSDPSKGYLVEDKCYFGAEVFVVSPPKGFSPPAELSSYGTFLYTIENFCELQKIGGLVLSNPFTAGGTQWTLGVYPKGHPDVANKFLSVRLYLHEPWNVPHNKQWHVDFAIILRNVEYKEKNVGLKSVGGVNFNHMAFSWGWHSVTGLEKLTEAEGYVKDNKVLVQVKFHNITMKQKFAE